MLESKVSEEEPEGNKKAEEKATEIGVRPVAACPAVSHGYDGCVSSTQTCRRSIEEAERCTSKAVCLNMSRYIQSRGNLPPPLQPPHLGRGRVPSEIRSSGILHRLGSGLPAQTAVQAALSQMQMSKAERNIDASCIPMLLQTLPTQKLPRHAPNPKDKIRPSMPHIQKIAKCRCSRSP